MEQTQTPLAHNISKVHEVAPWGRSMTFRLVAEGKLPARKLGRSTFVLHSDLVDFLAGLDLVAEL